MSTDTALAAPSAAATDLCPFALFRAARRRPPLRRPGSALVRTATTIATAPQDEK